MFITVRNYSDIFKRLFKNFNALVALLVSVLSHLDDLYTL
jgi:hypothetical protein